MNKEKVCVILLDYDPNSHRHWFHLYHFFSRMAKQRNVALLLQNAGKTPAHHPFAEVHSLSHPSRIASILRSFLILLRLRLKGYTLFYNHYTFRTARLAALICRLLGGRVVLWHCIQTAHLTRYTDTGWKESLLFRLLLKLVHHLVTGTEFMAADYRREFGLAKEKVIVVPNYIDLERFQRPAESKSELRSQLTLPQDRPIVLYLHELEPGRARILPEIMRIAAEKRPDIFFLVVGGGSFRSEIEQQVADFGLQHSVRFAGKVPNLDVPRYFAAADIYLVTSDFEAFSRVHLEAMALGIPIVSTDGGGGIPAYLAPEYADTLLPSGDATGMANRLLTLLDDTDQQQYLVAAGRRHVQTYSEDRVLQIWTERLIRD